MVPSTNKNATLVDLHLGPVEGSLDHLEERLVPPLAVLHDAAALRVVAFQDAAAGYAHHRLEWDVEAEVLVEAELHLLRVQHIRVHCLADTKS